MLVGAFASAAVATFTGSVWLGLCGRHRRDGRRLARPRLRLDRPARQPDRLRHGDQHGRRRPDRADRQRDLVARRTHARNCRIPRSSARSRCRSPSRSAPFRSSAPSIEELISDHDFISYLAFLMVPLTYWALYRTRFGLEASRGRRESGGGRHRGHLGARVALQRGRHLRRAGRPCGRLSGAVAGRLFPAAHERRTRASSRWPRSSSPSGGRGRRSRPACCSAFSTRSRSACRAWSCRSSARSRCRRSRRCPMC